MADITILAPTLWKYLNGDGKHLKVMATIADSKDIIQWAIFFGVKNDTVAKPNGDDDFKGKVNENEKIIWNNPHPLWLVPISEEAKNQALLGLKSNPPKPHIQCSSLTIHNPGPEKDKEAPTQVKENKAWNEYHFWIEQESKNETYSLTLEPNTLLERLSDKGKWLLLDINIVEGEQNEPWPVWLTTEKFGTSERLIVFPAPECKVVNDKGKYIEHEIWFGVRDKENGVLGVHRPFIGINTKILNEIKDGTDCPIVWRKEKRLNDVLINGNDTQKEDFSLKVWKFIDTLTFFENSDGDRGDIVPNIIDDFREVNVELKHWFHLETKINNDITENTFNSIFIRHYLVNKNSGSLFSQFKSTKSKIIRILQLCRPDANYLFTKIIGIEKRGLEKIWNQKTENFANGLKLTSAASPVAILPTVDLGLTGIEHLYIAEWRSEYSKCIGNRAGYSLTTSKLVNEVKKKTLPESKKATVSLPLIRHQNSKPHTNEGFDIKLTNGKFDLDIKASRVNDNGTFFQFILAKYQTLGDRRIRDGALSFELLATAPVDEDLSPNKYGHFRITLQLAKAQQPFFLWQWFKDIDKEDSIEAYHAIEDFSLRVKNIEAAGQDLSNREKLLAPKSVGAIVEGQGERSEPPLLILLNNPNESLVPNEYFLTFNESTNSGQNYRIDTRLLEYNPKANTNSSTTVRAVVLDPNPQSVVQIYSNFLQQPGFDDGAFVVAWRSPLNGWVILDDNARKEGFYIILPSQAIGENYIKGKPNPTESIGEEPVDSKVIVSRFGAPSINRVAQERLDRRYVAPPWDPRRLWGHPGDATPGIPFLESQFELQYGLTAHLLPENATIAEIASKLGEMPVPPQNSIAWEPTPVQQEAFNNAWRQFQQFYKAWQSRLAILEPSAGDDFGNATFDDGISFNARIQLTKGNDGAYSKTAGASLKLPVQVDLEPNGNIDNSERELRAKMKEAHEPLGGLAGGFHYGFESAAVYKELWRELFSRGSSSGEVKALAFSSLGGWGHQTARFASDKTAIKSTTTMGRTHFYAVERIGRIAVLWNKAKHVIQYERTVVPSPQFKEQQPSHLGRPLVRKVREYIEILQPICEYGDLSKAKSDASGSVLACTFKSVIIPVLSSWGHDVWGDKQEMESPNDQPVNREIIGWEVPLWKSGADPDLYPNPQAQLSFLVPPDSDRKDHLIDLNEPQNLWFYTDTRKFAYISKVKVEIRADNVDEWPPVKNVDFADIPEPEQYDIHCAAGNSPELMEAPLPGVLDVLPGFERFTFRVESSEIPTSVAGRYYPTSSIAGRVRTVSMSRGTFQKNVNWWTDVGENSNGKNTLAKLIRGNESILASNANGFKDIEKEIRLGTFSGLLEKYRTKVGIDIKNIPLKRLAGVGIPNLINEEIRGLWINGGEFTYQVKVLWRESLEGADALINGTATLYSNYYTEQSKHITDEINGLKDDAEDYRARAKDYLKQFKQELLAFYVDAEFSLDSASSVVKELLDKFVSDVNKLIEREFDYLLLFLNELDLSISIENLRNKIKAKTTILINELISSTTSILSNLISVDIKLQALVGVIITQKDKLLNDLRLGLETTVDKEFLEVNELIRAIKKDFYEKAVGLKSQIKENLDKISDKSRLLIQDLIDRLKLLNIKSHILFEEFTKEIAILIELIDNVDLQEIKTLIFGLIEELNPNRFKGILIGKVSELLFNEDPDDSLFSILTVLDEKFEAVEEFIKLSLLDFFGGENIPSDEEINTWLETLTEFKKLEKAIGREDVKEILIASTAFATSINEEFGRLAGEVAQKVKDIDRVVSSANDMAQVGKQTLSNFRSVYEEFTAPGMGLNRKTIALLVKTDPKDIAQRLSLTPCMARIKQFGSDLEGLGLRQPVVAITDRLLPALKGWGNAGLSSISDFDFSNILSDIGGMRLYRLFPDVKMPESARDKIKITQGFDKQRLVAWVDATVDLRLDDNTAELMSIGPFKVELLKGTFTGRMRIETGLDGKITKTNSGELAGSWSMSISATPLMVFKDAKVIFKDDKLTFDLDPKRMEMAGMLKMLTDATSQLSATGAVGNTDADGNVVEVFKVALMKVKGIPAGVLASLNIPPITIGGGTTAITNLSFGGFFMLSVLDEDLKFRFLLGVGFYLGKKEAPFGITIFILGGGGYVDCSFLFQPEKGITVNFAVSINVSAALAISLGPIKGSVIIMLGIEMRYFKQPQQEATVFISMFLHVIGQVDIAGIVSVYLSLLLQATYASGGGSSQLIGTGQIKLTIRVCRFFKIKVDKTYTKVFTQSGSRQNIDSEARAKKQLQSLS